MQNIVTNVCKNFNYNRLKNDRALGNGKSDNNNKNNKNKNKNKNNNNNNNNTADK